MAMDRRFLLMGLAGAAATAGCSKPSKFKTYRGPEVTRVLVYKNSRKMYLMHHDRAIKKYTIDLGFAPEGDKKVEGDGRTPEGDYFIDRRNPESAFHLSLGISYPNAQDIAEARRLGQDPGGDIFIHGQRPFFSTKEVDWTLGCISVTNDEMEDIYAMVRTGTQISIYA